MAEACRPRTCGHVVIGGFASADEVAALRAIADRGMAHGGGAGGPTILDLESGALSLGDKFVSVFALLNSTRAPPIATGAELDVLERVYERIRGAASDAFGSRGLRLTKPTFWSRLNASRPAVTQHDEYWHEHIDTKQYGTFTFTGLLYLSDHGDEFAGGEFELAPPRGRAAEPPTLIRPQRGQLLLLTSGSENPHRVRQVRRGVRTALTVPFTCDERSALGADWLAEARASLRRAR